MIGESDGEPSRSRSERRTMLRWWFEDRGTGRLVVGQAPNALLWLFIASWAAGKILRPEGTAGRALPWITSASLALWSLDEVARGVNPWRRTLGMGVLLAEAVSLLKTQG